MSAAATTTATSPTTHRRQWAESGVAGLSAGHGGKNGDDSLGRLLAVRTVGAGSVHGLQLVELVVTGRAVVFV